MKISRLSFFLCFLFVLCQSFSTKHLTEEHQNIPHKKLQLAYTTLQDSKQMIPINLTTGAKGTPINLQQTPKAIILSPDAKIAYIFSEGLNQIFPIDLVTKSALTPIPLEQNPQAMVMTSNGEHAYIIHENSNHITTIELATGMTKLLMTFENIPTHLSLSPDNQTLYIAYQGSNEIVPIDLTSLTPQSPILLSKIPRTLAMPSKDKMICVDQCETNTLSFLDVASQLAEETFKEVNHFLNLNNKIAGISLSPDGQVAYLTYENSNEITPIDLTTQTAQTSIYLDQPVQSLTLFPKQELEVSFSAVIAPAGQASLFDASSTKFFRGAIVDYLWDFGDGHQLLTEHPIIHHTYERSGPFNVSLEVTESVEDFPSLNLNLDNQEHPFKSKCTKLFEIPKKQKIDKNQIEKLKKLIDKNVLVGDVGVTPTTITLSSSENPAQTGDTVTFTATVSTGGAGSPTGSVVFQDGSTVIGTGNVDPVTGIATFSTSSLAIGSHDITANYVGDATFAPSTSNILTQQIDQDTVNISLTSSANPSVFGQPVMFTATLTSSSGGTPTGNVVFSDQSGELGTAPIINGVAMLTVSNLSIGSHQIDAFYPGSLRFIPSAPPPIEQIVNPASVSINLNSSANPAVFGQSLSFTATLTVNNPGSGSPTGTVTFTDGSTTLGTAPVVNGAAVFTPSTSLSVGSHSIVASYSGDGNFSSITSSSLSQVITQGTTSTSLASNANPSVFGQPVTLTATVSITSGAGAVTGTVTFFDGATSIGTGTISGGVASIIRSNLTVGTHSLTAFYGGDANFSTSTSPIVNQIVNPTATTTTVTSSLNPSIFGQNVTFTATVAVNSPSTGTPTGTVTFKDGTTTIGTGTLSGGVATFSTPNLSVGTHSITVVYNGTSSFSSSTSSTLNQVVNQGTTSTAVTASPNPSTYGQSVTFTGTVTVATGAGTPTGTVRFNDGATTLGTGTLNGSGIATFSISNLSVGTHSITAVYLGDTNFLTSTSSALSQVVNKATPIATLSSSTNPAAFGDIVTLTVNVDAPTVLGLPSGTVTFSDTFNSVTTVIGTETLTASGANTSTASIDISNFNAGTHSITVTYSGDTNFLSVNSNTISQVVNKAASTVPTIFSNSPNPTQYGQPVILRATVTGSVAAPPFPPTGTVSFFDGSTLLGTVSVTQLLANSSTAILSVSTLATGSHAITASYSGDINYPASNSSVLNQNVLQAGTTTALTSSVNPSKFGQSVTFTAAVTAVAPGGGQPTGVVNFYNGAILIGPGTLVPNPSNPNQSIAVISTSALTLGSHAINAIYQEDSNFTSSTSNLLTQVVVQDATSAVVTSNINPSNFGQLVTFTATISASPPGSGTPTGTVRFFDGSTFLGTGTLSGGVATFSTIALYPGSHNITVTYSGDKNFTASTSPIYTQVVQNTLPTVTTITSSRNSSPVGQPVTFSATVTAITGTPTGTVSFYDGGVFFGTGTLVSGVATVTEPGSGLTPVGTHQITALYNGDPNFDPSNLAIYNQYVVPYDTTTTLTSSPNPSTQAGATFTATVTKAPGSPAGPLPGSVSFYANGVLLTSMVNFDPNTGIATIMPNNLPFFPSPLNIVAVYSGNTDPSTGFASSTSNTVLQYVQQTDMLATRTTLTTSAATAFVCNTVVLQARVEQTQGFYTPTGTVTFFDSGIEIGEAILNSSGIAQLPISTLDVGTHTIVATYNSDSNYAFSFSNTITQTINPNTTTTTLAKIPALATTPYSQALIFIATVTPLNGVATGTVTFSSETEEMDTIPLDENGQAIYETSDLSVGPHTVTATYNSNECFGPSSGTTSFVIRKVTPVTSLTSQPNPSNYGDAVNLYATVKSPGTGIPTGTVTFFNGTTNLGTVTLNNGEASVVAYNLPAGIAILEARYSGDNNFIAINLPSVVQTVNKTPTRTQLVTFDHPTAYGENVTLSATVTSNVQQQPTGTITFRKGSVVLGTVPLNGYNMAILDTTNVTLGENTLTATYNGDTNFLSSVSNTFTQNVIQSETKTTVVSSTPNPSTFGGSVTFNVAVNSSVPGAGVPTGTVTGYYGSTVLGTVNLTNGTASFSTTTLPAGVQTIIVKYSGDTNFKSSETDTTQTVNTVASTTVITSSNNPAAFGQNITFTATITPSANATSGTVTFRDGTTVLGVTTLNGNNIASLTVSNLSIGTHSITARYGGNTNVAASTSNALSQVINKANSSTLLTSIATPSVYGQTVTFSAQVAPTSSGSGTPTGTITFRNGSTVLGSGTLDNTGYTSLTVSNLPTAIDTITAVYSGDANFFTSTSATLNQTVNKSATVLNVTATPNPSNLGGLVSLSVNVAPINTASGIPTGTVQAYYGSTLVGSGTLDGGGTAAFNVSNLPAGTLGIMVQYLGDVNYLPSSKTITQTVNQVVSGVTLTSSANPSVFGQSVTFTATISLPSGLPIGTISFLDGTRTIGVQNLNGTTNTAFLTTSTLAVGSHPITAVYSGSPNVAGATSTVLNQIVNTASTSTTLSSTLDPSVYGSVVILTANVAPVSPGGGMPAGTVTFTNGSMVIGQVALNGSGQAFLAVSNLPAGNNAITATYEGSNNYNSSNSNTINQIINRSPTIISAAANPDPANPESPVNFTVTVTPINGTNIPTGTVNVYSGTTLVATGTIDNTGTFSFSSSSLPIGTSPLVFNYLGNANFLPSSTTLTQVISPRTSTIALVASPASSSFGQPVNFAATVASTSTGTPTGVVSFFDGTTLLGTQLLNSSGQATFTSSTLAAAPHTITVVYAGDQNFSGASTSIPYTVNAANTTTSIITSVNPSYFGETVTFYATVVNTTAGSLVSPIGAVTFTNNGIPIGTATLNELGQASLTVSNLSVGNHTIQANYTGNTNFNSSSANLTQTVNQAATITNITYPSTAVNAGQPVTATVTVIPVDVGAGIPTGTVNAYYGNTLVGSGTLNSNGTATLTLNGLPAGVLGVELQYVGDGSFLNSAATLTQTVNQVASAVNLSSSDASSVFGQTVTFTATVVSGGATPTGTVTFKDGATVLGVQTLDGSGTATLAVDDLAVGSHSITAVYSGDASNQPATSAPLIQTVSQSTSTTSLTANPTSSVFGAPVTLTATVAPAGLGSGVPTGTVTFTDGSTVLGISNVNSLGQATLITTNLPIGSSSIIATYSGDANFSTSVSAALPFTVAQAATTTTITGSSPNPSVFGQPVTFFANVGSSSGVLDGGTVTFYDGTTALGTATVYNGEAIFTTSSLFTGGRIITAQYSGNANFSASPLSGPYLQTVNPNAVTETSQTDLTSTLNPSIYGDTVTFNIQVTSAVPLVFPQGTVTLYYGSTPLATLTLDTNGQASYSTSALPVGNLQVVALYAGDSTYSSSSDTLVQTVLTLGTSTMLMSSSNPSAFAAPTTFTATVTAPGGIIPTGTVTFYDGAIPLETVMLSGSGTAAYTTSSLATGSHTIQAVYNPTPNFSSSSSTLTQIITQASTSTAIVTASPNPANVGDSVTFVASVTTAAGQPTGTVTFYDGATPIGSSPVVNGLALFSTSGLSLGTHNIQAVYSGDANFAGSTSNVYPEVIELPSISANLLLTSTPNPSELNQGVTFTAALSASTGIPGGTVTFFDGSIALATVLVDANGIANYSTSSLTLGSHAITAVYNGNGRYASVTSSSLTQVVIASSLPNAPENFRGCQKSNKFLNRTDYVNTLHWDAPSGGARPLAYRIYRNAELTDFVAEVSANDCLKYEDRHRKKNQRYTYYIVAVNAAGMSSAVSTIIYPKNKSCQVNNGLLDEEWMLEGSNRFSLVEEFE